MNREVEDSKHLNRLTIRTTQYIVLGHVLLVIFSNVILKRGSYPSFLAKIVILGKIEMHEIQHSLKEMYFTKFVKMSLLKGNADFYILDKTVRQVLNGKRRI